MAANFISISDFVNDYDISLQNADTLSYFEWLMEDKEKTYLKLILGLIQYKELIDDLVDGEPITQKWIDFVLGKEYTYNENLIEYQGVKSFLVPLIYADYHEKTWDRITQYGTTEFDGKTPSLKSNSLLYSVYNSGVEKYNEAISFMYANPTVYTLTYKFITPKQVIRY